MSCGSERILLDEVVCVFKQDKCCSRNSEGYHGLCSGRCTTELSYNDVLAVRMSAVLPRRVDGGKWGESRTWLPDEWG